MSSSFIPKIDIDFWGNWQVDCQTRRRPFLRWAVCNQYGEEQKCADHKLSLVKARWACRQRSMAGKSPVC